MYDSDRLNEFMTAAWKRAEQGAGVSGYKRGDIIKVGPWCGVVLDVLRSDYQFVLEVDFVKNSVRTHGAEFVPIERVSGIATLAELQDEFSRLVQKQSDYFERMVEVANESQSD